MTENINSNGGEGDWGETELDPQEQRNAEIFLDDPTAGDNEPWSPPDRQPRGAEMVGLEGTETIDQRIAQEEPDVDEVAAAEDAARTEDTIDPDAAADDTLADASLADAIAGIDASEDGSIDQSGPEFSALHVVTEGDLDQQSAEDDADLA